MSTLDNILKTKLKFIIHTHSLPYNIVSLDGLPLNKKLELIVSSIDENDKLLLFIEIWGCIRIILMGYENILEEDAFTIKYKKKEYVNAHKHSEHIINSLSCIFFTLKKLLPYALTHLTILQVTESCFKIYLIYEKGEALDFLVYIQELIYNRSKNKMHNIEKNRKMNFLLPIKDRIKIMKQITLQTIERSFLFYYFARWFNLIREEVTEEEKNILNGLFIQTKCCYKSSLMYKLKKMNIKWEYHLESNIFNDISDKNLFIKQLVNIMKQNIAENELQKVENELKKVYRENDILTAENEKLRIEKDQLLVAQQKLMNIDRGDVKSEDINQENVIQNKSIIKKELNQNEDSPQKEDENKDIENCKENSSIQFKKEQSEINNLKLKINNLKQKLLEINTQLNFLTQKLKIAQQNKKILGKEILNYQIQIKNSKEEIMKLKELKDRETTISGKNTMSYKEMMYLKDSISNISLNELSNIEKATANHEKLQLNDIQVGLCNNCGKEIIKMTLLTILPKEHDIPETSNQEVKIEKKEEPVDIIKPLKKPPSKLKKPPKRPPPKKKASNPFIIKLQSLNYKNMNFKEITGKMAIEGYNENEAQKYFNESDFEIFLSKTKHTPTSSTISLSPEIKTIFDYKKSIAISIALSTIKQSHLATINQIYTFKFKNENLLKQLHKYFPTDNEMRLLQENRNGEWNVAELFFLEVGDPSLFHECIIIGLLCEKLSSSSEEENHEKELVFNLPLYKSICDYIDFFRFLKNDQSFFALSLKLIKFILTIITKRKGISIINCFKNEEIFSLVKKKVYEDFLLRNRINNDLIYDLNTLRSVAYADLKNLEMLKTEFSEITELSNTLQKDLDISLSNKKIIELHQLKKDGIFRSIEILKTQINELNEGRNQIEEIIGEKIDENHIKSILDFYRIIYEEIKRENNTF